MRLADILFSQGFGTRRVCAGLITSGHVQVGGSVCRDQAEAFDTDGLTFAVDSIEWPFHRRALVMLHKPAGYECSQKPKHHPSVYSLLPAPLRTRGVQAVGRLDADTTGLLLFTDDGALLHRWTSPKRHVEKVYDVRCEHAVDESQLAQWRSGVMLPADPVPATAKDAVATASSADGSHGVRLTLTEGRHHQVKRMVAAVGNCVVALHRSRFGVLALPIDLAPGMWAWIVSTDVVDGASAA